MTKYILFILLIIITASSHADFFPLGFSEFDFVYDRLEKENALNQSRFDYQLGPYILMIKKSKTVHERQFPDSTVQLKSIRDPYPFETLSEYNHSKTQVGVIGFFSEDIRAAQEKKAEVYEVLRGGLFVNPFNNVNIFTNFVLDEEKANDVSYTGKKWRGLAGKVENSIFLYRLRTFDFIAGRLASFWGPRNSLLIGSDVNLDGFEYRWRFGKATFSYKFAQLDWLKADPDIFQNRYFTGHRLDLHLSNKLRIGFFETLIYGGQGRSIDFTYLNPFMFYHAVQLNRNTNDNTFLGLDFNYKPESGINIYGQLVVDDFQIDNRVQSDQEPNEIGFIFGTYLADVVNKTDIKTEYSRVTNRTFNQNELRNRYLFDGELISAALGNDYDLFDIKIIRWLNINFYTALNLSYYRQGEGSIGDEWSEPWLDVTGDYSEPFPTGVVEKHLKFALLFKGFIKNNFFVDIDGGFEKVGNFGHIENDDRNIPFINIKLSVFIYKFVDVNYMK